MPFDGQGGWRLPGGDEDLLVLQVCIEVYQLTDHELRRFVLSWNDPPPAESLLHNLTQTGIDHPLDFAGTWGGFEDLGTRDSSTNAHTSSAESVQDS